MRKREIPPKEEKKEGEGGNEKHGKLVILANCALARENQLVQTGPPAIRFHTENNPDRCFSLLNLSTRQTETDEPTLENTKRAD